MTAKNYNCKICRDLTRPRVLPIEIVRSGVCAKCYCTVNYTKDSKNKVKEKPYEFTQEDWDNLWENNDAIRMGMPCDCSQESLKELTKFAQEKLVKYLHSNNLLEHNVRKTCKILTL